MIWVLFSLDCGDGPAKSERPQRPLRNPPRRELVDMRETYAADGGAPLRSWLIGHFGETYQEVAR
jgi:hypothetical protein